MSVVDDILEAVREAAARTVWSQGISLSRTASVMSQSLGDDEMILRVSSAVGILARTVSLFPEDDDWLCDCSPREEVCEHVVAAVIVLKRGEERGEPLPSAGATLARVGYRFVRAGGGLALRRVVITPEGERPLKRSVAAEAMKGRTDESKVGATPMDLEVERILGHRSPDWIPGPQMVRLLKVLSECEDLALDGRPITTDTRRVSAIIRVSDADLGGFLLQIVPDPSVTETFNNGVVLCTDVLAPLGEAALDARERIELVEGRVYRGADVSKLVSEVLPSLRRRARVDVGTHRLPETTSGRPRILVDTTVERHELAVMALIVYGDPPIARVSGGKLFATGRQVPLRDEGEERRLARRAQQTLGLIPGVKIRVSGEEAVALAMKLERFRGGEVTGEGAEAFQLAPPLMPRLDTGALTGAGVAGFDLDFETAVPIVGRGTGRADAAVVLEAWRDGATLVPLMDNAGWAPLPADWLGRFGDAIADLMAARDSAGELPRAALPDLARLCAALDAPPPPGFDQLRSLVEGFDGLGAPALPADLTATLRDYQRAGVAWLGFLKRAGLGGLLADDMGLGKTLQAICVMEGRTLVVCPTSVLHNWAAEIRRFRPGLRCEPFHGPRRRLDPDADVTLTTYGVLRADAERLVGERWDMVVLDEAQAIKNPGSQVARAAHRLGGASAFKLTMTGTPVENRLEELWSQLHFTNRGLLGGRKDFQDRYARPVADGVPGVAARLRSRIGPFVLRRLKRDVAKELPPRTDLVLHCALSAPERDVYDAIRVATRKDVVHRLRAGGSVLEALEALLRLRQAACHPSLVPGQVAETSAKVGVLMDSLETAASEGHKSLVFSQWTSLLDLVEPHLTGAGLGFTRLDGSTRDRAGVVRSFQAPAGPPVMLLSLKAGGTGLNLTAADHVFLLDPWWNPAVEDQAADRTHRIGQDRPVFVHRLVATDTVEERILALQDKKRELAEAALSGADRAGSLTRDDLLELLVD